MKYEVRGASGLQYCILEMVGSEFLIVLFYEGLSIYFRLYTAIVLSLLLIKKVLLLDTRDLFV